MQLTLKNTFYNEDLNMVQMAQNKLLRCLNGSLIKDRISVKTLIEKQNMLSINQLAAQVKLTKMWKAVNTENYPIQMAAQSVSEVGMATRADHQGRLIEVGHSKKTGTRPLQKLKKQKQLGLQKMP